MLLIKIMTLKEMILENLGSGLELPTSKIDMRSIEQNQYKEIGFVDISEIITIIDYYFDASCCGDDNCYCMRDVFKTLTHHNIKYSYQEYICNDGVLHPTILVLEADACRAVEMIRANCQIYNRLYFEYSWRASID